MMVKFGCGCIGIPNFRGDQALIFSACDVGGDDPSLGVSMKVITKEVEQEPITEEQEDKIIRLLNRSAGWGHLLYNISRSLRDVAEAGP